MDRLPITSYLLHIELGYGAAFGAKIGAEAKIQVDINAAVAQTYDTELKDLAGKKVWLTKSKSEKSSILMGQEDELQSLLKKHA